MVRSATAAARFLSCVARTIRTTGVAHPRDDAAQRISRSRRPSHASAHRGERYAVRRRGRRQWRRAGAPRCSGHAGRDPRGGVRPSSAISAAASAVLRFAAHGPRDLGCDRGPVQQRHRVLREVGDTAGSTMRPCPEIGMRRPAMVRSSVVLPPPLGPTSATTSPDRPSRDTLSSTGIAGRTGRDAVEAPGDRRCGGRTHLPRRGDGHTIPCAVSAQQRFGRRRRQDFGLADARRCSNRCSATTTAMPSSARSTSVAASALRTGVVELRERLVEHQHPWAHRQHPGEREPLPFAA